MNIRRQHITCILFGLIMCSCTNESLDQYEPTLTTLQIPKIFSDNIISPVIPSTNPQTIEGIALGKKLFFDTILSFNNTQACADCHAPNNAFSDTTSFSQGADGSIGIRNSMPLFNLAWNYNETYFWDGKTFGLEHQALIPVTDPAEMKSMWTDVEQKLQQHPDYPAMFKQAFGTENIDSTRVTKALAQFERTLISANSKFDRFLLGEIQLTPEEKNGFDVFMDEARGDCFHCHGSDKNPLWTDNAFHNNGLDTYFSDLGLGAITGDPADNGKFRTPSLRNLEYTAPYMHDGRFSTIEDVINHYSEGLKISSTIDPLMKQINKGGVNLSAKDKSDLKRFLLTLSDKEFILNPTLKN